MKKTVLYLWLVLEFYLIFLGAMSAFDWFALEPYTFSTKLTRVILCTLFASLGLAMNFHPAFKFKLNNTK